jgi:hypothetical protein
MIGTVKLALSSADEEVLMQLAKTNDHVICESVGVNDATPYRILHWLCFNSMDFGVLVAALKNKNSDNLVMELACSYYNVRRAAAAHYVTNHNTIKKLSKDKNAEVRFAIAMNRNTPANVLDKLANDRIDYIRYWVAAHKNTSSVTIKKLAKDKEPLVRFNVARNIKDRKAFFAFAKDKSAKVRNAMIENPLHPDYLPDED